MALLSWACWLSSLSGLPISYSFFPSLFPFSILDEGHTGVSLFMVLSGYLFAKLLSGKSINYRAFIWNRALRLLPLLAVIILIYGVVGVWRFYIACVWSLFFYLLMYIPGYLSYRFIESPFLKLRKRYIRQAPEIPAMAVGEPEPVRAEA